MIVCLIGIVIAAVGGYLVGAKKSAAVVAAMKVDIEGLISRLHKNPPKSSPPPAPPKA